MVYDPTAYSSFEFTSKPEEALYHVDPNQVEAVLSAATDAYELWKEIPEEAKQAIRMIQQVVRGMTGLKGGEAFKRIVEIVFPMIIPQHYLPLPVPRRIMYIKGLVKAAPRSTPKKPGISDTQVKQNDMKQFQGGRKPGQDPRTKRKKK
jgi:hypothetical protein